MTPGQKICDAVLRHFGNVRRQRSFAGRMFDPTLKATDSNHREHLDGLAVPVDF